MKVTCLIVIIDISAIMTVVIMKTQEWAVVRYDRFYKLYFYSLLEIVSIYIIHVSIYNLKVCFKFVWSWVKYAGHCSFKNKCTNRFKEHIWRMFFANVCRFEYDFAIDVQIYRSLHHNLFRTYQYRSRQNNAAYMKNWQ